MNGEDVVCESELYFDENNGSNLYFNEEISISYDHAFWTNFESQEMSINNSYLTPLKKCFKSVSSKNVAPLRRFYEKRCAKSH